MTEERHYPHKTSTLIKRLRRHARALELAIEQYDTANREGRALHRAGMAAGKNICWQAAGRLEDLADARSLIRLRTDDDPDYLARATAFLERTEGMT
jgi:hypothetical protein